MRTLTWGTAALVAAMSLSACGSTVRPSAPKERTPSTSSTTRPAPAAAVVVQLIGGEAHVDDVAALRQVPAVTILADGTVITPAAVVARYPGPALAPLQAASTTPAQVADVLAEAARLGLADHPLDFGRPPTGSGASTTLRITTAGHVVVHEIYALGYDPDPGALSATQRANRKKVQDFIAVLDALPIGTRMWVPASVVVVTREEVTTPTTITDEHILNWPIATHPAAPGAHGAVGCVVITGAEARTLVSVLEKANELDLWSVGGRDLALSFRALVPGAPGCAA